MSPIEFPRIYNPGNQTRQELIENFVAHREVFQDIFDDLASSEMKYPEQHYIIQGVRGQGKTTRILKKFSIRLPPFINNEWTALRLSSRRSSI